MSSERLAAGGSLSVHDILAGGVVGHEVTHLVEESHLSCGRSAESQFSHVEWDLSSFFTLTLIADYIFTGAFPLPTNTDFWNATIG